MQPTILAVLFRTLTASSRDSIENAHYYWRSEGNLRLTVLGTSNLQAKYDYYALKLQQ